ncbi:ADP-ribosylation factor-like protein 9 [Polypterus senegalus]|uniref:ADP-ribosylation factor-like protein 9 n=1 Tax=Polypterus senegalus TaxID=55291 RepID=UPI001965DE79|nr:ADP-ribosylation factor-like protein 9 [Polypterus senegalus]
MPGFKEIGLAGLGIAVTGGVVYAVWNYWSSRQRESSQRDEDKPDERPRVASEVKSPKKHVLVLGLDGSGKTSLLHCLATGTLRRNVLPTEGFNAVCLNTDEEQMEFLESMTLYSLVFYGVH